jgi:hypothetical protein
MCLRNPNLYYSFSFVSFVIGFLWLFKNEETYGFFSFTVAFAFLTIGIQFKSQEQISEQIDRNAQQIILNQNEYFEMLMDRFSDIRINFLWSLQYRGFYLFEYTIWKCKTLVDRAWKLVKNTKICEKNQNRLFNEFRNLVFHSGYNWDDFKSRKIKFIPSEADLKNFLAMCNKFKDFSLNEDNKKELNGMVKLFNDMTNLFHGKEKYKKPKR